MTLSRTRRSTSTVLLALLLVLVLALQRPAEALAPGGVVLAPSAAAALGLGTASGVTGAAAAGGIALVAGTAIVVVGAAALIGWGVVESGLWDWATGSDPVPTTTTGAGWVETLLRQEGYETPTVNNWNGWFDIAPQSDKQPRMDAVLAVDGRYRAQAYCRAVNGTEAGSETPTTHSSTTTAAGTSIANIVSSSNWNICTHPDNGGLEVLRMHWWVTQDFGATYLQTTVELIYSETGEAVADRQLVAQAECLDPVTSAVTTVTESTALYVPGSEPMTPGVVCPAGTHVSGLTITRTVDGDPAADEVLYDATPVVPLTGTQYDDCLDGSCSLALHRVSPDGTTADCADAAVLCVGWITDTDRHLNYRCMWGSHVVVLDDCEMFHAIDTDAQTGTVTQPDTKVDSDLGTTTDVGVGPTTEAEAEAGCSPWAWINPFSGGIAQGVACALEWAAVPDTAVVTQHLTTLDTQFMTKVPFAYADLIAPVVQGIPAATMSACAGNLWDLTPEDTRPGFDSVKERHGDGLLAVPCTPPSWWTPVDLLLTSMVVVGTAWGLWNIVGAAVGGPRDGGGDGDG